MNIHNIAALFPAMQADEYASLKADIQANGLLTPIWTYQGQIVDGRNRYRACQELGIAPRCQEWDGNGSLVAFVVSLNLQRRHLTSSQRAVVALDIEKLLAKEQTIGRPRKEDEMTKPMVEEKKVEIFPPLLEKPKAKSRDQAAAMTGTNPRYVSDAKRLERDAPAMLEKVRDGTLSIESAKRELKEERRENKREQNRQLIATTPAVTHQAAARYSTIVIDPPWDWGDEGDVDQFGRARPTYDTISIEQITALPVGTLAQEDAHIYLWITNRSLPKGFALLEAWGFRYVTCLTWCKPSIGMGNYYRGSSEQVLFGVRGSLLLLQRNVGTWFEAPRPSLHSAKPDSFYTMVESCSPGPWLEMFARTPRQGWVSWGAEV